MSTRVQPFGPLDIRFDDRVLEMRPWTVVQSEWAAAIARDLPPGPVLELCAGAGQIGLLTCVRTGRPLVQVEADGNAASFARANAEGAGVGALVEIRCRRIEDALTADERFPLIVADPPYLRRADVESVPDDPVHAVDGGEDGLDVVRTCLDVIDRHLVPRGAALLQLRGPEQVDEVTRIVASGPGPQVVDQLVIDDERAIALLRR